MYIRYTHTRTYIHTGDVPNYCWLHTRHQECAVPFKKSRVLGTYYNDFIAIHTYIQWYIITIHTYIDLCMYVCTQRYKYIIGLLCYHNHLHSHIICGLVKHTLVIKLSLYYNTYIHTYMATVQSGYVPYQHYRAMPNSISSKFTHCLPRTANHQTSSMKCNFI